MLRIKLHPRLQGHAVIAGCQIEAGFSQRGAWSEKKAWRRLVPMCAACWKHELNESALEDADRC